MQKPAHHRPQNCGGSWRPVEIEKPRKLKRNSVAKYGSPMPHMRPPTTAHLRQSQDKEEAQTKKSKLEQTNAREVAPSAPSDTEQTQLPSALRARHRCGHRQWNSNAARMAGTKPQTTMFFSTPHGLASGTGPERIGCRYEDMESRHEEPLCILRINTEDSHTNEHNKLWREGKRIMLTVKIGTQGGGCWLRVHGPRKTRRRRSTHDSCRVSKLPKAPIFRHVCCFWQTKKKNRFPEPCVNMTPGVLECRLGNLWAHRSTNRRGSNRPEVSSRAPLLGQHGLEEPPPKPNWPRDIA